MAPAEFRKLTRYWRSRASTGPTFALQWWRRNATILQQLAPPMVTRKVRPERRRLPESTGRVNVGARTVGLE